MRIFITGEKGFIGSSLTKKLKEAQHEWRGFDLQDGMDIRDRYALDVAIGGFRPDAVIHMAARAGVTRSKNHPAEYISSNILGTQNVVEMCNMHNVKRLIFFSSSSVFGPIKPIESIKPRSENDIKNPVSLYGISKLAGELITNVANCETVIVRPFTVYGVNGRLDAVIYKWINQIKKGEPITIYGDLDSYRGYVYVEDLVETVIQLLSKALLNKHEDFNIGGSEIIYLRMIVSIFESVLGEVKKEFITRPSEDIFGQVADTSKAKEILLFDPKPKFMNNVTEIVKKELLLPSKKSLKF